MKKETSVCCLCFEENKISEMSILTASNNMFGRDLGYVCKNCLNHIDNFGIFNRMEDSEVNKND